ncbi:histidinol dehydrogenase [Ulvibacter antarcticus]|uniref:Histidinol dehydrogenase n=1 Tax=Ulvibacter antarcticus TaxID=442714 RepID=A0A3L9YZL3_9FLAO|nr:histidinol dehydrogenase [Ulvibacter antarcticus]RMA64549.1 histidinol dehydrogenase [Ulvibacter antarcticus]
MEMYNKPPKKQWKELTRRPGFEKNQLSSLVYDILNEVKSYGNAALQKYSEQFDKVSINDLLVSEKEMEIAESEVSEALKSAIKLAKNNIEKFHASQQNSEEKIETTSGVFCWRKAVAIEKVGLYIPGGSAPLFSTILMLGIPAILAGCKEIVLCTPPNVKGNIHPAIRYTASLIGISKIFKVGGAQAIAAMAYGTETIPQVYKIFGPGNQYVTKAKELIQQSGTAIDMPAGPSEVLVIADKTGIPSFIASDLLSQAEHGADSQVILLSNDQRIIDETLSEVQKQLNQLPRKNTAEKALENSKAILLESMEACMEFSNLYAPEHLILASESASGLSEKVINAGSVFLGNYSCESAGDYASGTNHTLPTNGYARNYSGVSLESFQKKISFQELSKEGLKNIGPAIELMAEAEQLIAHKNAVSIRLKSINDV